MRPATSRLWEVQNRHPGDRESLFAAVAAFTEVGAVLYPGSWADVTASFVFDSVIYVDSDSKAAKFFADTEGVDEIVAASGRPPGWEWTFIGADYRSELDVPPESVDLLVSLYAGPVSEYCTGYLRPGGWLLANTSHGDVTLAASDARYELQAVLQRGSKGYRSRTDDLADYLKPRKDGQVPARAQVIQRCRGTTYMRAANYYLFQRLT